MNNASSIKILEEKYCAINESMDSHKQVAIEIARKFYPMFADAGYSDITELMDGLNKMTDHIDPSGRLFSDVMALVAAMAEKTGNTQFVTRITDILDLMDAGVKPGYSDKNE